MSGALVVAFLVAAGVYLVLQRGVVRLALGFVLLGHAANVLLVLSGGSARRGVPLADASRAPSADPLPQAFALTAIVIGFAMTAFLLALAYRARDVVGEDDVEIEEDSS
ncbi:MAG TPA: sodium:proton antiporter [Actinomycetota bacterium]|jgi:multicomponent Na+:H+ antiporter subunit C|nr:sodium:proton antiporter [Actinomycetota bacterium]